MISRQESNIQKTIDYQMGYDNGYKDGYNKALEHLIEQQKNSTEVKMVVHVDDIEEVQKFVK